MLQIVNVSGTLESPQFMSVVVNPCTSGTQIPDPAPLSLMPPTLAEPAVTLPTRALPLQSWNSFLRASQPIAEDTRCGGYLANVSVMKLEAWYLTLQPVQVLAAVAPSVPEYVPAPQSTHVLAVEAAVAPEYLPDTQSMQTEAPAAEYLPAPQSVHAPAPVTVLDFPAAQALHTSEALKPKTSTSATFISSLLNC